MILILSSSEDEHVPLVTHELDLRGEPYLVFDPGSFPEDASVNFQLDRDGGVRRDLTFHGTLYDLTEVTAVWHRRPNAPLPHADLQEPTIRAFVDLTSRHFLDGLWDSLNCLWLPAKPVIDRAAHNKLRQLLLASELGFSLPSTLITNSPSEFLEFYSDHPAGIVSKALIQRPLTLDGEEIPAIYTRPVNRRDSMRFASVKRAPVIFQESIPKDLEIRATVIGGQVFTAAIHSQEQRSTLHDWRHYHDERVKYESHELPTEVEALLLSLVQSLGLCFGAIDLILTPSGEYIFLEINPNGQWGFVEHFTGLPLASAMADLLSHAQINTG